jgi:hypothetical protein
MQLGAEAGHPAIVGWAHEMSAWFALTQGRLRNVIDAAQAGQLAAPADSVRVQLVAQEAKARARLGEQGLAPLLESGREVLHRLPYPDRPDNHFQVDPGKWDYYAMDVHRLAGDDDLTRLYASTVIADSLAPDGHELAPMRIAECRLSLAIVAAREGDLEQAVSLGMAGLHGARQSKPHLIMVAAELEQVLRERFAGEALAEDFHEAVRAV